MLTPDLTERIRTIFLHPHSFVSIDDATSLLGWSRDQMREAIEGQEVDLTTACSGKVVPHDELMALALHEVPIEWIERALGARAARVLPQGVRSRSVRVSIPRYQAAMLDYLAEQQQTTAGHLIAAALEDLVSERLEVLAQAIPGFADAVAWPHAHDELPPS
jgi:predicted transcriptional regulator